VTGKESGKEGKRREAASHKELAANVREWTRIGAPKTVKDLDLNDRSMNEIKVPYTPHF
jgi:hypothetical protein